MICKQCNSELREGAKFCGVCGCKVEEEQAVLENATEELQMPEEVLTEEAPAEVVEEAVEPVQETAEFSSEQAEVIQEPVELEEPMQIEEQAYQMDLDPTQVAEQVQQTAVVVEEKEVVLETVEDVEKDEDEPKEKKGKKFLRGFLSTLCCIMIFVLTTAMLSVLIVRESLKQENVDKMLNGVDLGELITLEKDQLIVGSFTEEEFEELYYETKVGAYIDNTIYEYAEYLRGGDVPKGISADKVLEIFGEESSEIEKAIGRYPEPYEYEAIQKYLGENGKENLGFLSEDVRTNDLLKTIRTCLSIYVVIALGVLILLFVFLLLKARKFRLDSLVWTSVPVIVSSVIIAVFGLIKAIAMGIVEAVNPALGVGTEIALDGIFSATLLNSAIVLGFGVLLIVVYAVTKKIITLIKKKKA